MKTLNLTDKQMKLLEDILGDAYAYRIGEASDLSDPDLEPEDRKNCIRYEVFARNLGLEIRL